MRHPLRPSVDHRWSASRFIQEGGSSVKGQQNVLCHSFADFQMILPLKKRGRWPKAGGGVPA